MSHTLIDHILNEDTRAPEEGTDAAIVIARPQSANGAPWAAAVREGELAVDVYQTDGEIVIIAVIGGVSAEDIAVEIHHDVVTIRGVRKGDDQVPYERYLTQECYWGPFSRTVVLPAEVLAEEAAARFRQGVLRIVLPKVARNQSMSVPVIAEHSDESYE